MAGDIIDTMLGWLLELFEWMFKKLFNLLIWLIKKVFKLIIYLFGLIFKREPKNETITDNTEKIDRRAVDRLYNELEKTVEEIDTADFTISPEVAVEKARDCVHLFVNEVLSNCGFTVNQKCLILETFNKKIINKTSPVLYNMIFREMIFHTYRVFEALIPSPLLLQQYDKFKREKEAKSKIFFKEYFYDLFVISELIGVENGKFSLEMKVLDKYNLPEYRNIA